MNASMNENHEDLGMLPGQLHKHFMRNICYDLLNWRVTYNCFGAVNLHQHEFPLYIVNQQNVIECRST